MARDPDLVNAARGKRLPAPRGLALLLVSALALGACSSLPGASLFESPRAMRGHAVDEEALAQITPGVTTRDDIMALLGSPSATGTFDNANWYYISSVTRQRPGRTLAIEDQKVVAISFGPNGTVQQVRRLGPEDGRDVDFVERTTPSPGTERTFLQALFGNIGRVGPGLGSQSQTIGAPTSN